MAYNEKLAGRIRDRLRGVDGVSEKTMFGGRVFLVGRNIVVGAYGDDLLVRVHPDEIPDLVTKPDVRPFTMGARATRGFVLISGDRVEDAEVGRWIGVARAYLAATPADTASRRGRTGH